MGVRPPRTWSAGMGMAGSVLGAVLARVLVLRQQLYITNASECEHEEATYGPDSRFDMLYSVRRVACRSLQRRRCQEEEDSKGGHRGSKSKYRGAVRLLRLHCIGGGRLPEPMIWDAA
jgi:hypothetical protein